MGIEAEFVFEQGDLEGWEEVKVAVEMLVIIGDMVPRASQRLLLHTIYE